MKIKATISLASLLCITALNAQEQEKQGFFQRLVNKFQNVMKTQEQITQERAAERAQQAELLRLKAVNQRCGAKTPCKTNEKCCVIPGNGSGPITYCSENCLPGAPKVD